MATPPIQFILDSMFSILSTVTSVLFVGIMWNPFDPNTSLNKNPACVVHVSTAKWMVVYIYTCFALFFFSTCLVAALRITWDHIRRRPLYFGIGVAMFSSAAGAVFFLLVVSDIIKMRLGAIHCGDSGHTEVGISIICTLDSLGFLVFGTSIVFRLKREAA